jgi:hypothetical protein
MRVTFCRTRSTLHCFLSTVLGNSIIHTRCCKPNLPGKRLRSHTNTFTSSPPTVNMKLPIWALYFATLSAASGWTLQAGSQTWTGSTPQRCKSVFIPRGAQISWQGTQGASTVQLFNVQGSCSRVYRTVMGEGEINASNNIYGFIVKA